MNPHLSQPVARRGPPPGTGGVTAIMLHGRDRDATDILGIADRIGLDGVTWVAPAAFGRSWYPCRFMEPMEKNQPQLDQALDCVDTLVADRLRAGSTAADIVLIGFSQGACVASEYAVRHARRYGGIIAFTGGLIGPPGTKWKYPGEFLGTPVLLGTMEADEWVPLERVRETARVMSGMGADVDLMVCAGKEHLVNDDEIARARELFGRVLNTATRMPVA